MAFLTNLSRTEKIAKATITQYDLIVIGGGITGAGIALEASNKGLKVLLVEKGDFASGTSSKSTKLIHGGLRYLKNFEFNLVREVASERKIVYQNARHLVRPEQMILPIYKGGSITKPAAWFGLWLYDLLGGVRSVRSEERRKILTRNDALQKEPLLKEQNLVGVGQYYEYRTDDSRLTIEVIKTASSLGSDCFNYTEVLNFLYTEDKQSIIGVCTKDILNNKQEKFYGKRVVNATGPWVDQTILEENPKAKKILAHTKGVHIVLPFKKLPVSESLYFDTDDNRMIFVIPRDNITYVGTTDTKYNKDLGNPIATKEDVTYLLNAVTNRLNVDLMPEDIVSSWSGLRPLIFQESKSPSEISRKDEIIISETGLISVAGGKLTGYRKIAEDVLKKTNLIQKETASKSTKRLVLEGAEFESEAKLNEFLNLKIGECKQIPVDASEITQLVYKYGTQTNEIIDRMFDLFNETRDPVNLCIKAELIFCIEREAVCCLSDFLIRRTGMLFFYRERITNSLIKELNKIIVDCLKLSAEQSEDSLNKFEQAYQDSLSFLA